MRGAGGSSEEARHGHGGCRLRCPSALPRLPPPQLYTRRRFFYPPSRKDSYFGLVVEHVRAETQVCVWVGGGGGGAAGAAGWPLRCM